MQETALRENEISPTWMGDNNYAFYGNTRDVAVGYNTRDANAACAVIEVPAGGAVDVPVLVVGIDIGGRDLGFFNGITQTTVAIIDADRDSWFGLDFSADDAARINKGGSAWLSINAGGDIAAATDISSGFNGISGVFNVYPTLTSLQEYRSGYFRINYRSTTPSNPNVTDFTGVEGVAGSYAADEAITFRGGHFRTYINADATSTMRTNVGCEMSARASYTGGTECVAESGTGFIGARIWMAPYFTSGSIGNINNFHALWILNEADGKTVTNAIKIDSSTYGGGFSYSFYTDGGRFYQVVNGATNGSLLEAADSSAGGWNLMEVRAEDYRTLTASQEYKGAYIRYNVRSTTPSNPVCEVTGVEGVAASYVADEAITFRGGYFRTYTNADATSTMRTAVGCEISARASQSGGTECVAESGTAFVGARIWMAPFFTDGSITNINNFHALWILNEAAGKIITNAIKIDASTYQGGFNYAFYSDDGKINVTLDGTTGSSFAAGGSVTTSGDILLNVVGDDYRTLTSSQEYKGAYIRYNVRSTTPSNPTCEVTGVEGAVGSYIADEAITFRGGYFRTYTNADATSTMRTAIGCEISARASYSGGTECVAEGGTAFVGARIWMAPYFTDGSFTSNINNSHALWIINETPNTSGAKYITNAIKIDATTYGAKFVNCFNTDAGKFIMALNGSTAGSGLVAGETSTASGDDWMSVVVDDYRTLTSAQTYRAGYFRYNVRSTTPGSPQEEVTGIEGVGGVYVADGNLLSLRGGHFRTYVNADATSSAKTSVGADMSARASYSGGTDCVALSGTCFTGARIWMAPYFTSGSLANINNFWGLWIYGEHATQRNADAAIWINDAGGGFTDMLRVSAAGGADADVNIVKVAVTGNPVFVWDESEDRFALSKGLNIQSGQIKVDTISDYTGGGNITFTTTGGNRGLIIESTSTGIAGVTLLLRHSSATPAANDTIGDISFQAYDAAATPAIVNYATINCYIITYADGTEAGNLLFWTRTGDAIGERWRISNKGVWTALAAEPTNVNADGAIIAGAGIAFTDVLNAWIDDATHGDGTTTIYIGNQTINTTSDMRVKRDIVDSIVDAYNTFKQLRVVDFSWNGHGPEHYNSRGRFTGLVAQETIDIVPWIINAPNRDCPVCRAGHDCSQHNSFWFVQYEHLVPLLVKGFQETDSRLVYLEKKVEELERELSMLKN